MAVSIAVIIGTVVGLAAGLARGYIDNFLMLLMDSLLSFPTILLAITVVSFLGYGLLQVMLADRHHFQPGFCPPGTCGNPGNQNRSLRRGIAVSGQPHPKNCLQTYSAKPAGQSNRSMFDLLCAHGGHRSIPVLSGVGLPATGSELGPYAQGCAQLSGAGALDGHISRTGIGFDCAVLQYFRRYAVGEAEPETVVSDTKYLFIILLQID